MRWLGRGTRRVLVAPRWVAYVKRQLYSQRASMWLLYGDLTESKNQRAFTWRFRRDSTKFILLSIGCLASALALDLDGVAQPARAVPQLNIR